MFSCFLERTRRKLGIKNGFNVRSATNSKKFSHFGYYSARDAGRRATTPVLKKKKNSFVRAEVLRELVEEKILKIKPDRFDHGFEKEVIQATDRYLNRRNEKNQRNSGVRNIGKLPFKKRVQVYTRVTPVNRRENKTLRHQCSSDEFRIDEGYFNKLYLSPTNN